MSNLNSKFQVIAGLPPNDRSALLVDFKQKAAESPILTEGMIVKLADESGVPVVTKLSSGLVSANPKDDPWLVIEGMDQGDASIADKVSCIRLKSGVIFQVATAESFTIGDLCRALAGVIKPLTGANEQAIGQIVGVNSADGTVTVATA